MKRDDLYDLALQCAKLNDKGCACGCEQCQYNIFNYIDDVREASLLKANAYTDYHRRNLITQEYKDNERNAYAGATIWLIIVIALIAWMCLSIKQCFAPPPTQTFDEAIFQLFLSDGTDIRPLGTIEQEVQYFTQHTNDIVNIPRILLVMRTFDIKDINKDGLINCIDYTLMFCMLYGSQARIIQNYNPHNAFNHMFVQVPYTRGSIDIEPQGTSENYQMWSCWGDKYNRAYNRDVTDKWTKYIPKQR